MYSKEQDRKLIPRASEDSNIHFSFGGGIVQPGFYVRGERGPESGAVGEDVSEEFGGGCFFGGFVVVDEHS